MKKTLFIGICFVAVLLASNATANATLWELDAVTANQFTNAIALGTDNLSGFYKTPPDPYGVSPMVGSIGFQGTPKDLGDADTSAIAQIYVSSPVGLSGSGFDGITALFSNDNDDQFEFELFYVDSVTGEHSSGFVTINGSVIRAPTTAYLTASQAIGTLDLGNITMIGFRARTDFGTQGSSDTFHVSLVPVPGALLLGLFGLGFTGLKLRKYA